MNHTNDTHSTPLDLTKLYLISLSILALLTILGHLLLQWALNQHANDTHLIEIASRQLLLSERLSKTALIIQFANNYDTRVAYVEEFRNTLDLLEKSNTGLQGGDSELRLSGNNSIPIINLFANLQEPYGTMDNIAKDLLMVVDQGPFHSTLPANTSTLVGQLIGAQYAFRLPMEAIVFQYQNETQTHLTQLKRIDFVLASLVLIVLLLEGVYLFQPSLQRFEGIRQELANARKLALKKETWLQGLLDHLPAFVTLKDVKGRYLFVNRPLTKLWRTMSDDIIGKTDYDLFHTDLASVLQAHDRQVLKTNTSRTFEETFPHPEGLHSYSVIKFPLYDGILGPSTICTIASDITNHQKTEQAMEECETILHVLLTATAQVVLVLTREGTALYANQAASQWLNIPMDQLIGTNVYNLFPAPLKEGRKSSFIEAIDTRTPVPLTEEYQGQPFQAHVYPIAIHGKIATKLAVISVTPVIISPELAIDHHLPLSKPTPGPANLNRPLPSNDPILSETGQFRLMTREGKLLWLRDSEIIPPVPGVLSASRTAFPSEEVSPSNHDEQDSSVDKLQPPLSTIHYPLSTIHYPLQPLCQRILNSVYEGIIIADATQPDLPILFVNHAFERLTGYTTTEVLGRNCRFLHEGDAGQSALDQVRDALRLGQSCKVTLRNRHKDGNHFWIQLGISPLHNSQGKLTHFVGIQVDITALKQTEQKLQESENQCRYLAERVAATILICQEDRIVYANPAATVLTGYPTADLLQMKFAELVPPDKQSIVKERSLAQPRSEQAPMRYEIKIVTQSGSERWLDNLEYIIEYQGKSATLVTAFDITERKHTENTLRQIVEGVSAHTGENFLKNLVEYLVTTLQVKYAVIGQLLSHDPYQMRTLFVVTSELQLLENFEYDLHHTPCEKLITGETPCCSYTKDVQKLYPNNPLLTQLNIESCVGTPLFHTNGKVMGLLAIMDDKPLQHPTLVESMLQIFAARSSAELERLQALAALQEEHVLLAQRIQERTAELSVANAEIAQAARLKNEFLANMSHELRTPLSTILTMSEALQNELYGTLTPPQIDALRTMADSGHHLLDLINDILDLAKIEAGKIKLQILPVSPRVISNACLRVVKPLADKKLLHLGVTLDSAITTVQADDRYLNKILLNLLTNAIKFTPKGGEVNLDVRGDKERGVVSFTVSDTGIGMAAPNIAHLFRLFEQLDPRLAREHEGAGLGLFLVYRLAEMHGGGILVQSEEGKGSRFTINLPWPSEDDLQEFKNLGKPLASRQEGLILLVEDDPHQSEKWAALLELYGYQVITAQNGVQAIEKARENQVNLILMDYQMPVMDGLKAMGQIRANPKMAHIPIVILTALTVPGDKERCLEAGASRYLTKPFNFKELIAEIKTLL